MSPLRSPIARDGCDDRVVLVGSLEWDPRWQTTTPEIRGASVSVRRVGIFETGHRDLAHAGIKAYAATDRASHKTYEHDEDFRLDRHSAWIYILRGVHDRSP